MKSKLLSPVGKLHLFKRTASIQSSFCGEYAILRPEIFANCLCNFANIQISVGGPPDTHHYPQGERREETQISDDREDLQTRRHHIITELLTIEFKINVSN